MKSWWEEVATKVPRSERRRLNGVVIYTFWNIWKERNRRIFDNKIETVTEVAARIKEDIEQRKRASLMCSLFAPTPFGSYVFPNWHAYGGLNP